MNTLQEGPWMLLRVHSFIGDIRTFLEKRLRALVGVPPQRAVALV